MNNDYEAALGTIRRIETIGPSASLSALFMADKGEIEYRLGMYPESIASLSRFIDAADSVQETGRAPTFTDQIERARKLLDAARSKT